MSIQELQQLIQTAVFMTAKQKTALTGILPNLSTEEQTKLGSFLIESHQNLSDLRKNQAHEWIDLMKNNFQKIKQLERKGMQQIETVDQENEETQLDDLINQL